MTPPVMFKRQVPSSGNQAIMPACIIQLYGIPIARANRSDNVIAVPGFLNEIANKQDLATFLEAYRPDLNDASFSDVSIDGGNNPQDVEAAGVEASLDIQYTVGLANFLPVTFYSVGQSNFQGFMDLVETILRQPIPPTVLTISYGYNEPQVPLSHANRLCNLFAELGARGVSVIVASGDGGVAGADPGNTCSTFVPTFPASCPYVTSVGATAGYPESGTGFSAGGFSSIYPRPSYQNGHVDDYLRTLGNTLAGRFTRNGRAYPDVAAQGRRVVVILNRQLVLASGISASAPIFASVITLINDRLMTTGRKQLGFLNPLLYARGGLNDIVNGNNPACNTNGFPATSGWDLVTGLGTPNFAGLMKAAGL